MGEVVKGRRAGIAFIHVERKKKGEQKMVRGGGEARRAWNRMRHALAASQKRFFCTPEPFCESAIAVIADRISIRAEVIAA